jgi:hypothetical protein
MITGTLYYIFPFTIFSTSFSSGNLPSAFLENISSSSSFTSNTPPEEGIKVSDAILFVCSLSNFLARPTAAAR